MKSECTSYRTSFFFFPVSTLCQIKSDRDKENRKSARVNSLYFGDKSARGIANVPVSFLGRVSGKKCPVKSESLVKFHPSSALCALPTFIHTFCLCTSDDRRSFCLKIELRMNLESALRLVTSFYPGHQSRPAHTFFSIRQFVYGPNTEQRKEGV